MLDLKGETLRFHRAAVVRCLRFAFAALVAASAFATESAVAQTSSSCQATDVLCTTMTAKDGAAVSYGVVASSNASINIGTFSDADFVYGTEDDGNGNQVPVTHTVSTLIYSPDRKQLAFATCTTAFCTVASPDPKTGLEGLTLYVDGTALEIDKADSSLNTEFNLLFWPDTTLTLTKDSSYTLRIPASTATNPTSTTCETSDIWCATMTVAESSLAFTGYANFTYVKAGSMVKNTFTYGGEQYEIGGIVQALNPLYVSLETSLFLSPLDEESFDDVEDLTLHVGSDVYAFSIAYQDYVADGLLSWDTPNYEITIVKDQTYEVRIVAPDTDPEFSVTSISDQSLTADTAASVTLPAATKGNGTLSYSVTPALPDGLSLDATTRVLSGTPTTSQLSAAYTYQVADADSPPDTATLSFNISVSPAAPASLSASADDGESALSWSDPSDTGISGWQFSKDAGATWQDITPTEDSDSSSLQYTATGLTNGTEYTFQIRAYVESGATRLEGAVSEVNVTLRTNSAPVIVDGSTQTIALSIAENSSSVVTVTVTDADNDDVTFSVSGTDNASFSVTSQGYVGSVTTASGVTLDFESDKTSYAFTVDVSDGVATTSQAYTVTVTDVAEVPSAPEVPSVTANSTSSLGVSWSKPVNTGPDIDDYDVQYREIGSSAAWSDAGHTGTALTATLSNLSEATTYEVQVRATSDEGTSGWSASGTASTLGFVLSTNDLTIDEGASGSFTVALATEPSAPVTVSVSSADSTAPLTLSPASLVFTPANWDQGMSVTVEVLDDSADNDGRSYQANLAARGGDYEGLSGAVNIAVTDDEADPRVTLALSNATIEEDGGTSEVTASIDVRSDGVTTIEVSVAPPGAGVNISANTTLTIAAGDTTSTGLVTLTSVDNDRDTPDRPFAVVATATNSEGVVAPAALMLTVEDDDEAGIALDPTSLIIAEGTSATYSVVLTSEPIADVTVTPSAGDDDPVTLSGALTFLPSNWDVAQTVTVTAPPDDDLANDARGATIGHSLTSTDFTYSGDAGEAVSVTITDDETPGVSVSTNFVDVAEGDSGSYTVVLASQPTDDVTVTPTPSADAPFSVSSPLIFTSTNWGVAQTVTVSGPDDDSQVNAARSGSIGHVVTSSDTNYDGFSVDSVVVTVLDNDSAGVDVSAAAVRVTEGGQVTYNMQLTSEPSSNVTVAAAASVQGQITIVASPVFTPQNWDQAQPVILSAVDDNAENGTRGLTISHQLESEDDNYDGQEIADVAVTILDDEQAGLNVSPTEIQILEGQFGAFNLVLTGEPIEPVQVTPSAEGVDFVEFSDALTFTSGNWDVPQRVVVSAIEDDVETDARQVTVRFTVTSDDVAYRNLSAGEAIVRVLDNDGEIPIPSVSVAPARVYEGDQGTSTLEFIISLSLAGTVDTTMDWKIVEGTATVSNGDFEAASGTLTIPAGETLATVSVTINGDLDKEGNETLSIELSNLTGPDGVFFAAESATGTIIDEEQPAPTSIALSVSPAELSEEGGMQTITVTALAEAGVFGSDETLTLSFAGGSAAEDADYKDPGSISLIMPAGAESGAVEVVLEVIDDIIDEPDEVLALSGVSTSGVPVTGTEIRLIDNDEAPTGFVLSTTPMEFAENAGSTMVEVTASVEGGAFIDAQTLTLSLTGDTAVAGVDFAAQETIELVVPAETLSGTLSLAIEILDDPFDEPDEMLQVTGTSAVGLPVTSATVTIVDDDAAPTGFMLTATPTELAENAGATTIEVTASVQGGVFEEAETLTLMLASDTADGGADFAQQEPIKLVLPAGAASASANMVIEPVDDPFDEPDEMLQVTGTSAVGLPVTSATVTIVDDDSAPTGFMLTATPAEVAENAGATTIEVTASVQGGVFEEAETLTLTLAADTAGAGADFAQQEAIELVLPAGAASASANMVIEPVDDPFDEPDEMLQVTGTSAVGLSVTSATVTIVDDDAAPTGFMLTATPTEVMEDVGTAMIEVTASVQGGVFEEAQSLTLMLAADTAMAGTDFAEREAAELVVPAGAMSGSVSLAVEFIDDPLDEPDEFLQVTGESDSELSVMSTSIKIVDDDATPTGIALSASPMELLEAGGVQTIEVTATVQGGLFAEEHVLTLHIREHTASAGEDFTMPQATQLVVPGGAMTGTASIALEVLDDRYDEPDETLHLAGESASGIKVTGTDLVVLDDDASPTGIALTVTPAEFSEGDGTLSVQVTATIEGGLPATEVSVDLSLAGGSATAGVDYSAGQIGSILVPLGVDNASTEFDIRIEDDAEVEPEETLELSGTSDSLLPVDTTVVRLTDNDQVFIAIDSGSEVSESDAGADVRLVVRLSSESYQDVQVSWQTADGSAVAGLDYEAAFGVLNFAQGLTEQAITVRVLGDELAEDTEEFAVRLSEPVNADLGMPSSARIVITDDDLDSARGTALEAALAGMARTLASDAVDVVSGRMNRRSAGAHHSGGTAVSATEADPYALDQVHGLHGEPERFGGAFGDIGTVAGMGMHAELGALGAMHRAGRNAMPKGRPGMSSAGGGYSDVSRLIGMVPRSFNLDLSDCGEASCEGGALSVWAKATRSSFSGQDDGYSTDGDLLTGYFGVDWSTSPNRLGGLLLSHTDGDLEFELDDSSEPRMSDSEIDVSLTSFMPYGSWQLGEAQVWGLLGVGEGDIELSDRFGQVDTDLDMRMLAFGGKRALARRGLVDWSLNSDVYAVELKSEGVDELLGAANAHAERVRLLLEARTEFGGNERSYNELRVEFGGRWDGGTASEGLGADLAAAFLHRNTATGLNFEANGRYTLAHGAERLEEQSFGVAVEYDPGVQGMGASFRVSPAWNQGQNLSHALPFEAPMHFANMQRARSTRASEGGWMPNQYEAEFAYGLKLGNGRPLHFYSAITESQWGRQSLRLGAKLPLSERTRLWMHAEVDCGELSLGSECRVQLRIR